MSSILDWGAPLTTCLPGSPGFGATAQRLKYRLRCLPAPPSATAVCRIGRSAEGMSNDWNAVTTYGSLPMAMTALPWRAHPWALSGPESVFLVRSGEPGERGSW